MINIEGEEQTYDQENSPGQNDDTNEETGRNED